LPERNALTALQTENARLIALLESHGIEWHLPPEPITEEPAPPVPEPEPYRFSTAEKVALFRRLFRGRTDVYPVHWESKTTGKSGYTPACANEWRTGVCEKPDAPRVLLATGKLVGEGFDHPPLDTLVLAMPVSWKGTLQQYAGRLHREHASKTDVRIIDFVDTGHPALLRMLDKRQRGYRAMGYQISSEVQAT
jgi:hypothetical protein